MIDLFIIIFFSNTYITVLGNTWTYDLHFKLKNIFLCSFLIWQMNRTLYQTSVKGPQRTSQNYLMNNAEI